MVQIKRIFLVKLVFELRLYIQSYTLGSVLVLIENNFMPVKIHNILVFMHYSLLK